MQGLPLLRATFDWRDNEVRMSEFTTRKAMEIAQAAGATIVGPAAPRKAPYDVRVYQTTHITGGTPMGADPKTSVVSPHLQHWDAHNLFVVGASTYPQNSGYNPTGPLCALSLRLGDDLNRYNTPTNDSVEDTLKATSLAISFAAAATQQSRRRRAQGKQAYRLRRLPFGRAGSYGPGAELVRRGRAQGRLRAGFQLQPGDERFESDLDGPEPRRLPCRSAEARPGKPYAVFRHARFPDAHGTDRLPRDTALSCGMALCGGLNGSQSW